MNWRFFIFIFVSLLLANCTHKENGSPEEETENIPSIPATHIPGKLVALVDNNLSSYYINKGQPRGFEYEMLRLFCDENNLELEIRLIKDFDYLLDSLTEGIADLAAGNLTVTSQRLERVSFTQPLMRTRQVLVQRLPENHRKLSRSQINERVISDALDLDGKTVHVNAKSSYREKLANLSFENGLDITIEEINASQGIDDLVEDVSKGHIDYTILDENLANFYKRVYDNLHTSTPISLNVNIAWAAKKGNTELIALINSWFEERKGSTRWNMIYNRYYKYSSKETRYLQQYVMNDKDKQISRYDHLIRKHALYLNWDWRLLAALVRKESGFNPNAQSAFGARGLMQVLPTTAERFGVSGEQLFNPELNLAAGTRFLQWLTHFWTERLTDHTDLDAFVMASYNAGPGHVMDAMKLAQKHNLNPEKWEDNVEIMLFNKSKPAYYRDEVVKHGYCRGREPVNYVEEIYRYYEYYKAFTFEEDEVNPMTAGL